MSACEGEGLSRKWKQEPLWTLLFPARFLIYFISISFIRCSLPSTCFLDGPINKPDLHTFLLKPPPAIDCSTYSCYCIDGYTGSQCQTNWDECWSSPCQNGAVCIDGVAHYNCSCPEGFAGNYWGGGGSFCLFMVCLLTNTVVNGNSPNQ